MKRISIIALAVVFTFTAFAQYRNSKLNLPVELNVMTLNVRVDVAGDGINNWKYRKDRVADIILKTQADVVGTQEVLHNQLLDMEAALTDYTSVGVGRIDGAEAGEYSAIFYNHNKFTEIGSGYFWLSENPFAVGVKGWDAAYERIATWAKLKDNVSGKVLFVLNTHFDHVGKVARRESAKLILEKVNLYTKKLQLPVIVMGDFNATPESEVIKILTDKNNPLSLTDSRSVSPVVKGLDWSFHGFGQVPMEKRELLDYIFVKNNIKVIDNEIIDGTISEEYISDHNPVFSRVQF